MKCEDCKHIRYPKAQKYDGKPVCIKTGCGFITQDPYDSEATLFNTVQLNWGCIDYEERTKNE